MIHYDDYNLQLIERAIRQYNNQGDYWRAKGLLEVRKEMLNAQAMSHQKELLPDIIAFNDALRDALKIMYDRALSLYQQVSAIQPNIHLEAKCFLDYNYPKTHPYQADYREDLWEALSNSGNRYYETHGAAYLVFNKGNCESFDSFIGMVDGITNWNEHFDSLLTKDLQLIEPFHSLFEHMNFALTDFIFVREFNWDFSITNDDTFLYKA
jgi:hypothetical protein